MEKKKNEIVNTTCSDLGEATNRVVAEQVSETTSNEETMETSGNEPKDLIEKEMEKDFSKVSNAAGSDLGDATNRVVAEQMSETSNSEEGMETSVDETKDETSESKELSSESKELRKKEALVEKMREDAKKTTSIREIYLSNDGSICVEVARVPLYSYGSGKDIAMTGRQESYLRSLVDYQSNCNLRKVNKYAASKIIDMVKKYEIPRRDIYVFC